MGHKLRGRVSDESNSADQHTAEGQISSRLPGEGGTYEKRREPHPKSMPGKVGAELNGREALLETSSRMRGERG
jgi:hypothetical protein